METRITTTTRWGCQHGLGAVGVLHYHALDYAYHYSDYFCKSIRDANPTFSKKIILWVYDNNGSLEVGLGGSKMIPFYPGIEIGGIKIHNIDKKQKPMGSGIAYIGLMDDYYEVTFDFLQPEKSKE